ncbi:hypothetical protein B0H13DRAFT_1883592 [Mycena leptocephala]|nr:hypothetical protein B0H13DRAFT_1883592 [Mycena leptocephala]
MNFNNSTFSSSVAPVLTCVLFQVASVSMRFMALTNMGHDFSLYTLKIRGGTTPAIALQRASTSFQCEVFWVIPNHTIILGDNPIWCNNPIAIVSNNPDNNLPICSIILNRTISLWTVTLNKGLFLSETVSRIFLRLIPLIFGGATVEGFERGGAEQDTDALVAIEAYIAEQLKTSSLYRTAHRNELQWI